ncbi:hypothetical protein BATDEDRAFT_87100 [Batrachochytrium dendrobatidis JAM81]|uniref:non-specific serine/threonine protein kinase n=2 Tax=Batrachochytrium dendrobatidis TaxID=109871 RepID=F4NXQ4_BATDJ|nr:uncharacterized protein BATDEDRAFT_87100 [Batrachochytrium dendrobatidis JAM81]EGF82180.1 hypothetical protein BATDEDRAFT_87100 [Batrachochytrium dendrobatidis JAM81]|eukprot:XP_006677660.1 hypothetical protein BATDEDRAFT_87100 [Batrachochytrium dendrobatidis JAM81]
MLGGKNRTTTFGKSNTLRRANNTQARRQLELWDELQQETHHPARMATPCVALDHPSQTQSNSLPRQLIPNSHLPSTTVKTSKTEDISKTDAASSTCSSNASAQTCQSESISDHSLRTNKRLLDQLHSDPVATAQSKTIMDPLQEIFQKLDLAPDKLDIKPQTNDDLELNSASNSSLNHLLNLCNLECPIPMTHFVFGGELIEKIGEATYSDVYSMWRMSKSNEKELVAVKVIPVGQTDYGDQLSLDAVAHEIHITQTISKTQRTNQTLCSHLNFVDMVQVSVCTGPYSKQLLDLWQDFDSQKGSENMSPNEYADKQLYVIMMLKHEGIDLEHTALVKTAAHVKSVLLQVLLTLAQAEQQMQFEHRDLHWGNILINTTLLNSIEYSLSTPSINRTISVPTAGIKITIIDFALSRLEYGSELMFMDLERDPEYFTGPGPKEKDGDLQFDIYRLMREAVEKNWKQRCSKTNIFWIHYLCDKLKCVALPRSATQKKLDRLGKQVLKYNSVLDMILSEMTDTKSILFLNTKKCSRPL